jgi:hypothetical protein
MAAATDVLSLDDAKKVLSEGRFDTTREDIIARGVTGLSTALDEMFGPIVQRTITDELHDGGRLFVRLRHAPVSSITTLTEASGTTQTVLTAESFATAGDYLAQVDDDGLLDGRILRRSAFWHCNFAAGRQNIKCTYVAGRFANTAAVESRYGEALAISLISWFRAYTDSVQVVSDEFQVPYRNFPTFAIPMAAKQLLADQLRPVVA